MNTVCKVFYTVPGSDHWHHMKWMNTEPEDAIKKTLKKYKRVVIQDTIVYTPQKGDVI